MPRRAIVLVLDGCGAGEAPDAALFGDTDHPSTLKHVVEANGGLHAPILAACGYLDSAGFEALPNVGGFSVRYGRLQELSLGGKDSVTGHWEMMGAITKRPFPTYPDGFPISLIKDFERAIETQTLGNRAASGTQIIADLGQQHLDTGFPIVYTSADSVFQIACHEDIVPIEKLYDYCRIARGLCVEPNDVQRVIARPFVGDAKAGFTRTDRRKDFPLTPPPNLCDAVGDVYGIGVVPELFDGRGFRSVRRTQNNAEHWGAMRAALDSDARFIFANFEDFDMRFGHRNDPKGFAGCLEEFDSHLAELIAGLTPGEDLLILTADHGNDPTTPSTDHSREFVPVSVLVGGVPPSALGDTKGMDAVGATVAKWLDIPGAAGTALI
ncbi:MAG: phosphopentomutase [Fimbriimonadaceae bacterium]|nr:phosphopentomutase [Fimbriimonadaceae bacterium]